ncbi:hypothetical protein C2E23DRAFT_826041 [Lenzites betulinus]|nr:hypothetical protein C2E23DRAFT_826041 [Lenzites betulinus]
MVKTTFSRILSDVPRKSQIALQVRVRPSCCFPAHTSPRRTSAGEELRRRPGALMRNSTKNCKSWLYRAYRSAASRHASSRAASATAYEGATESGKERAGDSLWSRHAHKDPGRPAQARGRLPKAMFVPRMRTEAPHRSDTKHLVARCASAHAIPSGSHTRPRSRPYKAEPVVPGRAAHRPSSSWSPAPSTSRTRAARQLPRSTAAGGDVRVAVPRSASQCAWGASPMCTVDVVVRDACYGARGPSTCVVLRVRTGCERTTSVERCDPPGHPWMSIASRATRRVC